LILSPNTAASAKCITQPDAIILVHRARPPGATEGADNSQIAARDSAKANSEEIGGLIAESIAYYGTYTVNEVEKVVLFHLDASTFPNQIGTDQKRIITSLTGTSNNDEFFVGLIAGASRR
jgi:Lipocalin-like domain